MKKWLLLLCIGVILMLCFVSCACENEEAEKQDTVTVKFETYIDTGVPEQKLTPGSAVAIPTVTLKRPGYNFAGWYNEGKKWDFDKNKVTKDITLTAKWEMYLSFVTVKDIDSPSVKALFTEEEQDSLIVTGCDFYTADIVIPKEYNGKKIVGIYWAFANRAVIKNVTIPDTVTFISANAFNRCSELESVVIPKSVTKIEAGAFSLCDKLTAIYCEVEEMPSGWHEEFNKTGAQVVFGYKGE